MPKTTSRTLTRGLAVAAVGVLALAGCSSDKESKSYQASKDDSSTSVEHDAPASGEAEAASDSSSDSASNARGAEDPCSERKIADDIGWPDSRIVECDPPWALAGFFSQEEFDRYGTIPGDSTSVLKLENGRWERWTAIPSSDKCQGDTRKEGAPSYVVDSLFPCDDESSSGGSDSGNSAGSGGMTVKTPGGRSVTASRPACDGRGVLIVQSVIDVGGNVHSELAAALDAYPDAQFSEPGACGSLRPSVNGQDVYAVWIDYGNDISGLCSAAATNSYFNARILKNQADYSSPC